MHPNGMTTLLCCVSKYPIVKTPVVVLLKLDFHLNTRRDLNVANKISFFHQHESQVNNITDQLDTTITILLIFESAQHVSGNLLPIFRSVRLWFTAMWFIVLMLQQVGGPEYGGVDYVFGVRDVPRATSLTPNILSKPPHSGRPTYYNIRTIHHIAVNQSLMLLKMGKRLPETC